MSMGVYIKGMEMPTTGLYFVSVDNTGGEDKTVATVERMLGNRDVRQIVGSFELIPVPPHGRLIDADAVTEQFWDGQAYFTDAIKRKLKTAPTIISAEEGEG